MRVSDASAVCAERNGGLFLHSYRAGVLVWRRSARPGGSQLHQPEIGDLRLARLVEQDIVGFEVAVDETLRVRRGQPLADLDEHFHDLTPGPLLRVHPAPQGAAAQELHRQEHLPLVNADVVDADDVRVRQLRDRLGLADQSLLAAGLVASPALLRAQHLERDLAVQFGIVSRVNDAHRAGAEALQHQVAPDGRALGEHLLVRAIVAAEVEPRQRPQVRVAFRGVCGVKPVSARPRLHCPRTVDTRSH